MSILDGLTPQARALAQNVEAIFGAENVTFTSGKRSHIPPGGSKTSQHFSGNAFDFQVKGLDPMRVQERISEAGFGYGQSIAEYGLGMGPRNHLSTGDKRENLVAKDGNYKKVGEGLREKVKGWLKYPFDDDLVDGAFGAYDVASGNKTVGEAAGDAVSSLFDKYFGRVAIALFALILLAAALFMLKPNVLPSLPGAK